MPLYGQKSMSRVVTCERDIQIMAHEFIKIYDHSVIFGHRTPDEQFGLFKKGRRFIGTSGEEDPAKWLVEDIKKVVTYRDGYVKKSNHNYDPSRAIDIAPYPINWGNEMTQLGRFYFMAGKFLLLAQQLFDEGRTQKMLKWGGDWDSDGDFTDQRFHDLPHFELIM